jgi:DNA topoisomerase-1
MATKTASKTATQASTSTESRAASKKSMSETRVNGGKTLVVVESPTKAKTIRKYLGKDYIVESCMGHIRDLPQSSKDIPEKFKKQKWAQLGVDVEHDFEPIYCVPKTKTKVVSTLREKLKQVDRLLLATDEDREGESISWHLIETLKPQVPFRRMVFNEITKEAILLALSETREIDANLVRAQEARRILDRLVGYTISPLLWKKVAYGLSAGRVQSVAVRLIVEREHERLKFRKAQYWDIEASHEKESIEFTSRLISWQGRRVATGKDFDASTGKLLADRAAETQALNQAETEKILVSLKGIEFQVAETEEKPVSRKPPAPFITSTLQQESNRKLGLSARETMQVAQSLYEQGFITYMRTDSNFLSQQALDAARTRIKKLYGAEYLPDAPRTYEGKKAKGAQEAHEAIRPAGTEMLLPDETGLSGLPLKLYDLIWKRTVASQMVNSRQKQLSVKFTAGQAIFAASGMTIEFPGFLRAYVEGRDDEAAALEEKEVRLPTLARGQKLKALKLDPQEHETKPPARFTEASLVQTMEKEGIGRPSTYASIIGTIIDRGYVRKAGNALVPTFTALVVARLLAKHLPQYVDLGFTSEMETKLDEIAEGDLDSIDYLRRIYFGDRKDPGLLPQVEKRESEIDPEDARAIEFEEMPGLSFRVGRYGAYVCRKIKGGEECASLPDAQAPADVTTDIVNKLIDQKLNGSDALGKDPKTGLPVYALTGRYGPYVQLGDVEGEDSKPKRISVPAGIELEKVDLPMALKLLELPRTLGSHPGTGKEIKAGLGRFGPYVVHDGDFRSIPKTMSLFDVDLKQAMDLLSKPKQGRGRAAAIRELGPVPGTDEKIQIFSGRYGPYAKLGAINASLPEGVKPEDVSLEVVLNLIREREEATGKSATAKSGAKSSRPKKSKTSKAAKVNAEVAPTRVAKKPTGAASAPVRVKATGPASGAIKTAPKGKAQADGAKSSASTVSQSIRSKEATKPKTVVRRR